MRVSHRGGVRMRAIIIPGDDIIFFSFFPNTPGFAKYLYKYILVLLTAIIIIIIMIWVRRSPAQLAIPLLRTTGLDSSSSLNVLIFAHACVCVCVHDTYTFIHKTTFIIHRNYDDSRGGCRSGRRMQFTGIAEVNPAYRVVDIYFTNRYIIISI